MSRFVKILGWLIAIVVAVFVLAAVAFYLFFDANNFRDEIADAVEQSTGRELVIDGDVSLSVFPWLAVDVGAASVGNAAGFGDTPFARIERAQMGVSLLPLLLRQEIVVGSVTVDGLQLNLEENRRGVTNWDDLMAADAGEEAVTDSPSDAAVNIASVEFVDATINYFEAAADSRYVLTDAALRIGAVTGTRQALVVDGVALDGMLEGVADIPSRLRIETDRIGIDTVAEMMTVAPLDIDALGMRITAVPQPFSYADSVQPVAALEIDAFSPRSLMTLYDTEPPVTADPVALSRMIIEATAALKSKSIELSDVSLKLDDTTFTGTISVPRGSTGRYEFDLDGDSIDLTRYMEPTITAEEAGAADVVPVEIPSDLIRPLNARGNLRMAEATLGNLVFENAVLGLNMANGRLRLHPVSAALLGGTYNGDVRVDVAGRTPVLSVDERVEGVDLAELAQAMFDQQNITGKIDGRFTLSGRGEDMTAVQRSLSGNMSFELADGSYEGTDIWYELRRARALFKKETLPEPTLPARTRFSAVKATGVVKDGVMRNDDLFAELPFMQLTGKGSVDLAAATVNYGLTARVLEKPESMTDMSADELDDFTEAVIPLKITGSLMAPSVKPDVGRMLRERVEEDLKGKLLDRLRGRDIKEPPADEESADAAPGEEAPEEAETTDPKEELKDELKDKLKGLFD